MRDDRFIAIQDYVDRIGFSLELQQDIASIGNHSRSSSGKNLKLKVIFLLMSQLFQLLYHRLKDNVSSAGKRSSPSLSSKTSWSKLSSVLVEDHSLPIPQTLAHFFHHLIELITPLRIANKMAADKRSGSPECGTDARTAYSGPLLVTETGLMRATADLSDSSTTCPNYIARRLLVRDVSTNRFIVAFFIAVHPSDDTCIFYADFALSGKDVCDALAYIAKKRTRLTFEMHQAKAEDVLFLNPRAAVTLGFKPPASQTRLFHLLTYNPGESTGDHRRVQHVKRTSHMISKDEMADVPVLGRGLEVRASNIPGAGRGVFAGVSFEPGEIVSLFFGLRFHESLSDSIRAQVTDTHIVANAAQHENEDCVRATFWYFPCGQFVNHHPEEMNCAITKLEVKHTTTIVSALRAIRKINIGDELYTTYGKEHALVKDRQSS